MESYRNIVAVASENSARFIAKIDPVRLTGNEGMALVSIYHGGVSNITSENNMVYFSHPSVIDDSERLSVELPEGNYGSSFDICMEISNLIRDKLRRSRKDAFSPSVDRNREIVNVNLDGTHLFVNNFKNTPWSLLGVAKDQTSSFSIPFVNYQSSSCPAFVYASIVENSYINGKLSRVLAVVPIKKTPEWSLYHPPNLNYVPISIKEFSNILIEIRDLKGQYVAFDPNRKPIITLRIASINTSKARS